MSIDNINSIGRRAGSLSYSKKYKKENFQYRCKKDFKKYKEVYIMLIPVILFYLIFSYKPMYGALIAFKEFSPAKGIIDSPWVGFKNFIDFFTDIYFWRILQNTLWISISSLVWGFPAPIILALLINELKNKVFVKTVQTITYLPYFVSLVVICGMIKDFVSDRGVITTFAGIFGFPAINMLQESNLFVPVYVISDIWQGIGWGSIIYLAALSGISQDLYEAATIDGAGRWRQTLSITIPGIMPTIIVLLILRMGGLLSVGFEKIILLYNPAIYATSDVISSYVYRKGILEQSWSFSTAVGLFNSVINFILIITANRLSRKFNDRSIW